MRRLIQVVLGGCVAMSIATQVAAAPITDFRIYIYLPECTEDIINNGSTAYHRLTPEECYELLHPRPKPVEPSATIEPIEEIPDHIRTSLPPVSFLRTEDRLQGDNLAKPLPEWLMARADTFTNDANTLWLQIMTAVTAASILGLAAWGWAKTHKKR